MKATYRAFDSADEITAAFSVRVNPEGTKYDVSDYPRA